MKTLRILEWNINQRSSGTRMPSYITKEIQRKDPDIIVLVEFKGQENLSTLQNTFSSDFYLEHYEGDPTSDYEGDPTSDIEDNGANKGTLKKRNGILIALRKDKFEEPLSERHPQKYDETRPDWLNVHTTLLNSKYSLEIIGVKVVVGGDTAEDLENRKSQIQWLLSQNSPKNSSKKTNQHQLIIGDLNYGPHVTEYLYPEYIKRNNQKNSRRKDYFINWQDIIKLMWKYDYVKQDSGLASPYAPTGTSWKSERLDWLITTKGISVNKTSEYNCLDWSFGRFNTQYYAFGYTVPEGYFICSTPSHPDHAIFTAEIQIKTE
ncbi:endonuclease/exonuclease/phosphatase family protein [Levilactobacillus cerevisiae]|uniref:endonuclease/exonuclease/phosphatase family protein n=1 Tax=Levilactobacillus cerevisiae TaxID=1704076 RepID=UPI000F784D5D|nr:endonuclease/exonuclease/phosphatase family protein [Levilactobacillus cerevisiae]